MNRMPTVRELEWIRRHVETGPVRVVRQLPGGQHAETFEISAGARRFVFRRFPTGDDAVRREAVVLGALVHLGDLVPRLIASDPDLPHPLILTSYVPGGPPAPGVDPATLASGLGRVLASIHAQDAADLPDGVPSPPTGNGTCAKTIRRAWSQLDMTELVLTHRDFWSGNTVWSGDRLTGVIDWSGAHRAPRGVDLAWCRQDLALLYGVSSVPNTFLDAYQRTAGVTVPDIRWWDIHAGARAEDRVEEWAPNYSGIGRPELSADTLRTHLDAWNDYLLGGVVSSSSTDEP